MIFVLKEKRSGQRELTGTLLVYDVFGFNAI